MISLHILKISLKAAATEEERTRSTGRWWVGHAEVSRGLDDEYRIFFNVEASVLYMEQFAPQPTT
jgi:hypothetical protein